MAESPEWLLRLSCHRVLSKVLAREELVGKPVLSSALHAAGTSAIVERVWDFD